MKDESTDQVAFPVGEEYVSTSLELSVSAADGTNWRVPLTRRSTSIGPPGRSAHLKLPGNVYIKVSWLEQQLLSSLYFTRGSAPVCWPRRAL